MSFIPGFLIAIILAFMCAIWAPWPTGSLTTEIEQPAWPSQVPGDWPKQPTRVHSTSSVGLTAINSVAADGQVPATPNPIGKSGTATTRKWRQWVLRAGFPMRCFSLTRQVSETVSSKTDTHPPLAFATPTNASEGISVPDWTPLCRDHMRRSIPTQPLWLGLFVNSVVWAAVLWLLWMAARLYRARSRVRRGRCPRCNYPIRTETAECSECGQITMPTSASHWIDAVR